MNSPAACTATGFSLIVTADDFGIGVATSRGIIRAHLQGPVTATSLMTITGDHAAQSVPLLAEAPHLDVGLHLVLTGEANRPLKAGRSSGLVCRSGNFHSLPRFCLSAALRKIHQAAVEEEIAAQAQEFRNLLGRSPDYVDGHHHTHQFQIIRRALVAVMDRGSLPKITRLTIQPTGVMQNGAVIGIKRGFTGRLAGKAALLFAQHQVRCNDFFFGMLSKRELKQPFPWQNVLANLPREKIVEWCVHPGEDDPTLIGRDAYQTGRLLELNALTDASLRGEWESLRPFLARKSVLFKPKSG